MCVPRCDILPEHQIRILFNEGNLVRVIQNVYSTGNIWTAPTIVFFVGLFVCLFVCLKNINVPVQHMQAI